MRRIDGILPRFVVLIALVSVSVGGVHALAGERATRLQPESVMGPGYNPPPPWIPVS